MLPHHLDADIEWGHFIDPGEELYIPSQKNLNVHDYKMTTIHEVDSFNSFEEKTTYENNYYYLLIRVVIYLLCKPLNILNNT